MLYWKEYNGHVPNIQGIRKRYDNTIYTFDIETSSYLILNNNQIPAIDYLKLSKKEQENSIFMSNMYIWMFGINDVIYYGRTWDELYGFLLRIENWGTSEKKFVYVHNLAYEFQYLRNRFNFKSVFARKSRKPMKFELENLNFEFRCTYMMTNCSLEKLPNIYQLPVKKLVGNLDYSLVRNRLTTLSDKEMLYCENDCLVVYEYIKKELEKYQTLKAIPLTSTGHVRKELKELIDKDWGYKNKVRKAVNIDGHVYNLLLDAFAGGYTHANWIYTDEIIEDVHSWDFTSSYPYVMTTCKFPSSKFKKCRITKREQLLECFAYLIRVKLKGNIRCKYYNNFISQNKCKSILKPKYDNGRVIGAEELEIVLTDVDLKFIFDAYEFDSYEFIEVYYANYDYLPKQFIEFILKKYVAKTEYKGVEGKELEYALEKAMFNSLYGMAVTNNIKDSVTYDENGWRETPINNEKIIELLQKEEKQGFLSFAYGVWVTAYARNNLLRNLIKLDKWVIYADTDSLKVFGDYDKSVIENYNKEVEEKIRKVSEKLEIDINKFKPKDKKGKEHLLGVFDNDGNYDKFITQGAKKYAYIDSEDKEIHITVSRSSKKRSKST